jgi:uncharacterized protein YkwD
MWKTRCSVVVLTVLALTAPSAALAKPRLGPTERAVVARINSVRAEHGLARVHAAPGLNRAADVHSADMLAHDFFAHESSDGTPFDQRIRRYHEATMLGENLAALSGAPNPAAMVVQMWMESPGHREIMLTPGFRRIGLAARTGSLGADRMMVVTADFASRR